jgi:hypothetical protein
MPMKRYKPEVEIANGKTTPKACKETEITQQSWFRRPAGRTAK